MASRRPRSLVHGVIIHNAHDELGHWIPRKFELGSWVTLHPGIHGVWSRVAHARGATTYVGAYKGHVKGFGLKHASKGYASNNTSATNLKAILVRHSYMGKELNLDLQSANQEHKYCNY